MARYHSKISCGALIKCKDKYLLIFGISGWTVPKGQKKNNESIFQAARREVFEETGVLLKFNKKDKWSGTSFFTDFYEFKTVLIFFKEIREKPSIKISKEHTKYKWFTKKSVLIRTKKLKLYPALNELLRR
jgi:8-oxo-dGTP pyrophosphatase MutT (NUDIX family)